MVSIAPLYSAVNNRYKGVYKGPGFQQWDAIVCNPFGKLERKGRYSRPEAAAQVVANYYADVYGADWAEIVRTRCKQWRITKQTRYPHMADLHRGPRVVVYSCGLKIKGARVFAPITPRALYDQGVDESIPITNMWHEDCQGWKTVAAALVALRLFRKLQTTTITAMLSSPPPTQSASAS